MRAPGDFDVEGHLAVYVVLRVAARLVGLAVNRDGDDLGRWHTEVSEIDLQVGLLEAAAEFQDGNPLPLACQARG